MSLSSIGVEHSRDCCQPSPRSRGLWQPLPLHRPAVARTFGEQFVRHQLHLVGTIPLNPVMLLTFANRLRDFSGRFLDRLSFLLGTILPPPNLPQGGGPEFDIDVPVLPFGPGPAQRFHAAVVTNEIAPCVGEQSSKVAAVRRFRRFPCQLWAAKDQRRSGSPRVGNHRGEQAGRMARHRAVASARGTTRTGKGNYSRCRSTDRAKPSSWAWDRNEVPRRRWLVTPTTPTTPKTGVVGVVGRP